MFREMRRKGQILPLEKSIEILKSSTSGVMALLGDDGYPYSVPMSYVYDGEKIYFHSAPEGHKVDAVRREAKASFCVVAEDNVMPEKYTTAYRSVIAFGKIHIIEDPAEKRAAIEKLGKKYAPAHSGLKAEIDSFFNHFCMMCFEPEHITGKEAIEYVRMRKSQS